MINENYLLKKIIFFLQIPIYRGATEALIPNKDMLVGTFHGENGFADVDFWDENNYPSDVNTLVQKEYAIEIIRDLVLKVILFKHFILNFLWNFNK